MLVFLFGDDKQKVDAGCASWRYCRKVLVSIERLWRCGVGRFRQFLAWQRICRCHAYSSFWTVSVKAHRKKKAQLWAMYVCKWLNAEWKEMEKCPIKTDLFTQKRSMPVLDRGNKCIALIHTFWNVLIHYKLLRHNEFALVQYQDNTVGIVAYLFVGMHPLYDALFMQRHEVLTVGDFQNQLFWQAITLHCVLNLILIWVLMIWNGSERRWRLPLGTWQNCMSPLYSIIAEKEAKKPTTDCRTTKFGSRHQYQYQQWFSGGGSGRYICCLWYVFPRSTLQ